MENDAKLLPENALHQAALHEAGHAVMARYLGLRLGPVRASETGGRVRVCWPGDTKDDDKDLRILLAARACLNAFGVCTVEDQGGFRDEGEIATIIDEIFCCDETGRAHRERVDEEVEQLFKNARVRAAAEALAKALVLTQELDGGLAERIIDGHLGPRPGELPAHEQRLPMS